MASSRAAADAERDRRYRFWRGVSILAAVAVILAAWAYVNASHLGLPVERWERQLRETIAEVAGGGGKLAEEHGAGADAPIVNEPDQSPATGGLSREELEEIEGLLGELDFEPGPVDGKIDDATRQAIRDYQAIAGTAETGEASRALLRELREVQAIMERENKPAN